MIPTLTNPLGLPQYHRLQYLESTGTQWIDTGLIMSGADFTIEWEADTTDIVYDRTMFGTQCRDPENASNWIWAGQLYCTAAGKYNLYIGRNYKTNISISGGRHTFQLTLASGTVTLLVDGSSAAQITGATYPPQTYPTTLFANNYNGAPQQRPTMKLYGWKAVENGVTVRDMIPVLDKSGVPCMYDQVTRTPKYNAGTGAFNYD